LVFYLSSRRRHMISIRDWSSDVCSSDLREMLRRDRAADTQGVLARLEASLSQPNPAADALASSGDTMDAGEPGGVEAAQELKAKADAMGVLIRSGVTPESAAKQAGLSGLSFLDARPVTLDFENGN